MRLAVVLIHYHTPELLVRSVDALRVDLAAGGRDAEILVIDNGSDEAGRARIASLPVRCLRPEANLGYAGGVNLGAASTDADAMIFMNPDVEVLRGCLSALMAALESGAAVAGPRFYWEHGRRLMLPPTEAYSRRHELLTRWATRGEAWSRWARRRWRAHAQRHWLATTNLESLSLSGALLAIRRDAWRTAGPFDDGFPLYFEETDWLRRLPRLGLSARYVPAAAAVHHYNQSAAREPKASEWFVTSAARFERRHYGAWFVEMKGRLRHHGNARLAMPALLGPGLPTVPARGARWIEVSPLRRGYPAAGAIVDPASETWALPDDVWRRLAPGTYYLTAVDDRGHETSRWTFEREASGA